MIWLIKNRENKINNYANNLKKYFNHGMEPADVYIKHIKPNKLSKKTLEDAEFHLFQLMEIYVTCKITAKWLSLKSDEEQITFFHQLTDINCLRKICSYSDSYCSQFEFNSFSELMKSRIEQLFSENVQDAKNAFQECDDNFSSQKLPDGLTETDAITSMLSFYINQGIWQSLRVIPTRLCPFEKMYFQNKDVLNFDFISNDIMVFNKKFELEPIFDNLDFYNESAKDCFIYILSLSKKLYDSENERIIMELQTDVGLLKQKIQEHDSNINEIYDELDDLLSKKDNNKKLLYYQSLSQKELIEAFYQFYKVPKNFLEILQTQTFEDKIILNKEFHISTGFQALIISYLDEKVENRKDMALLKVLFHIKAKNPAAAKDKYVQRLKNFKNFINLYSVGA